ncbi:hypothetical protein C8Q75DRAFT_770970 [Abortiporus biennis]|nr:hypothetical protein C8Q75DRAFT_770970 [Abortiporus biennis]
MFSARLTCTFHIWQISIHFLPPTLLGGVLNPPGRVCSDSPEIQGKLSQVLAWVLYEDKSLTEDNMVLLDHTPDLMKDEDMEPVQDHIGIIDHLEETYGAFRIVLVEPTYRMPRDEEERGWDWDYMKIFWMTDMLDNTAYKQAFQAYGNEPTIDFIYATVCLVVDIGPVDYRRV